MKAFVLTFVALQLLLWFFIATGGLPPAGCVFWLL
jgi:hypothetical protein